MARSSIGQATWSINHTLAFVAPDSQLAGRGGECHPTEQHRNERSRLSPERNGSKGAATGKNV
jgi:hypothetical protein